MTAEDFQAKGVRIFRGGEFDAWGEKKKFFVEKFRSLSNPLSGKAPPGVFPSGTASCYPCRILETGGTVVPLGTTSHFLNLNLLNIFELLLFYLNI